MVPDSNSPTRRNGGWSFDTLKTHIIGVINANDQRYEQRFADSATAVNAALAAARIAVDAALSAAKEAVLKAEGASDKRFESVNEFRETLADQQRTFIPRSEAEMRLAELSRQVDELKRDNTQRRGQLKGAHDQWAYIVGAVGVILALVTFALRFMAP